MGAHEPDEAESDARRFDVLVGQAHGAEHAVQHRLRLRKGHLRDALDACWPRLELGR